MKWHGGQGQEAELTANSACGHGHVTAPQHEAGQPRDRGDEQRDGQKLEAGRRAGPWRGNWAREGPSSSPDPGDREAAEQGGLRPGAARPGEAEATWLRDSFTGGKAPPGSANGLVPQGTDAPQPHTVPWNQRERFAKCSSLVTRPNAQRQVRAPRTPRQDAWVGVTAPAAGPEHREGLGPREGVGCFVSHR